jgi:hypothetical protein
MKKMTIFVFEEYIKHSKKILWRMVVTAWETEAKKERIE